MYLSVNGVIPLLTINLTYWSIHLETFQSIENDIKMFKILILAFIVSALTNYYSSINPNSATFRQDLKRLISNHKVISYQDVWKAFIIVDVSTTCRGGIEDIYSSKCWVPQKDQCGTYRKEGDCYNREHGWPKSW